MVVSYDSEQTRFYFYTVKNAAFRLTSFKDNMVAWLRSWA